jgi:hypothetical protein
VCEYEDVWFLLTCCGDSDDGKDKQRTRAATFGTRVHACAQHALQCLDALAHDDAHRRAHAHWLLARVAMRRGVYADARAHCLCAVSVRRGVCVRNACVNVCTHVSRVLSCWAPALTIAC